MVKEFTCESCMHYHPPKFSIIGQCRRHPPKVFILPQSTPSKFPEVSTNDWCSEYAKEMPGTKR